MTDRPADFIASFMDDYFAESDEHLTAVRRNLLLLEGAVDGEAPAPVVEELFRSFHSLKGISAMVELKEAERLAHEMETCLGLVREHRAVLSAPGFEALVDAVTALEQVIVARRAGQPIPAIDDHVARLAAMCRGARSHSESTPSLLRDAAAANTADLWKVTFTPSPDLVARGVTVDSVRARLSSVGRILDVTPRVTGDGRISFDFQMTGVDDAAALESWSDDGIAAERATVVPPKRDAEGEPQPPLGVRAFDAPAAPANFVRVDLVRLDDLMRLVGDLVVSRARLEDALHRAERFVPSPEWRALQEETDSIERQLRDLREGVMRVRLVPVAEIFRRMPFVVRDLARDNGKRVQLELAGQGTEIDKFLIERMMDPVLHLVRNAVSHGIELPDERVAAGKRPEGTIRLAATTVGETVVLEVSDDGRGIDIEAIATRARASGIAIPDNGLDPQTVLDLICSPGFSTKAHADRESGRGVGMDVVRETVQEVGGTLSVDTRPGLGTTFHAVLPLTLAITDALIVHAGDRTFAVPQAAVHEVGEVDPQSIRTIENNELFTHRGQTLPVVRLARLFGIESAARSRMHMMVIGTGLAGVGLLVDRISGQREIVVKMLRDPLVTVAGISGATELGDGRLILILDVAGLTRRLRGRGSLARAAV
jgi:two-component system, chemotaxis family, sensor kinase CheA